MYLNLDLVYIIETYLYPLYYYSSKDGTNSVYCPITKKYIFFYRYRNDHYEHISIYSKYSHDDVILNREQGYFDFASEFLKCDPFKLNNEIILFLKTNKRI